MGGAPGGGPFGGGAPPYPWEEELVRITRIRAKGLGFRVQGLGFRV